MSINKLLASIALILALLTAFIGTPLHDDVNIDEIATLIEAEKDHITPLELAEQVQAGKNIRVVDLRDSVSYVQQHIVNAEIMSIQKLLNGGVKRNECVVLYSEGGIHASQAWIVLKMKHYDSVYTLLGGFNGWKEEVLHPRLNAGTTAVEKQDVEGRKTLSLFFGGEPTVISQEMSKKNSIPKNQAPQKQNPPVKVKKEEEKLRSHC